VLGDFENQAVAVVAGFQRGEDGGQFAVEVTSTTAPMTWLILPVDMRFILLVVVRALRRPR
jgi:hypothetical protein